MSIASVIDYRNAIYQGQTNKSESRHGFGVLISDESEIIIC